MKQRLIRLLSNLSSRLHRQKTLLGREKYSLHEDITYHYFGESETISYLPHPYCMQDLPDRFHQAIATIDYPQPFILEIKKAKLRGRHAVAFTSDDLVIMDSIFNHAPLYKDSSTGRLHYPDDISQAIKQITSNGSYERVFSLVNLFSSGFYHWLIDSLPRLWLLKQYEELTGHSIPVLIDPEPPDYVLDTLHMMDIRDIIMWDVTFGRVEELLIPAGLHDPERPSGFATAWVRETLFSALGNDIPQFNAPKIYISRALASKRRVVNENQVIEFLETKGFQVFSLERMSIQEQIGLFAQAKIVLGPHGAGLANTIFSSNVTILEFFEPSYLNPCYFRLSRARDFQYGFLLAESEHFDMSVNIEMLEALMYRMSVME